MIDSPQKPLIVSAEALLDLESELATPPFLGVPIGSTLGNRFFTDLFLGNGNWDIRSINMDRLRRWYRWLKVPTVPPEKLPEGIGRYLFTWSGGRSILRDLVLPLLQALGPAAYHVIGQDDNLAERLPLGTQYISWDGGSPIKAKLWRREYNRSAGEWRRRFEGIIKRYDVPRVILPHYLLLMLVQSQRVMAYGQLLDQLNPAAVITEFDRGTRSSGLILAARTRKIPTVTMFHGMINPPYGYVPLLADVALCWGEQHRSQMVSMGTDPERLKITGCQRLSRSLKLEPNATRTKIGLPPNLPLILLATNPIHPDHRRMLVRVFCQGLASIDDISSAIRLHPSEKLSFYAPEISAFPNVRFLSNDAWTLDESIAAADVVACHDSGFGTEAILKGKPVVVLDVLPRPLGNGRELVEKGQAPCVETAAELSEVVGQIIANPSFRNELIMKGDRYVRYFCAAFGDQATQNIIEVIREITKPK